MMKTKLIFILLFGMSCLWTNAQILVNTEPVGKAVASKVDQKATTKKKTVRSNNDPVDGKKKGKKSKTEEVYGKLGYSAYVENVSDEAAKNKVASFKLNHYKKLANSYRLTGDTKNAESAYAKVLESDESAIYYLYFAQALQSNKKYEEAKDAFLSYHNKLSSAGTPNEYNSERYNYNLDNDARGEVLAEACDRVANFKVNQRIKLKNVKELNGGRLDLALVITKKVLYLFLTERKATILVT